jgi:single-strand DNA-binding protein
VFIVICAGNLGRAPELRYTAGGTPVAELSVAHKRVWTQDGERKEETIWVSFTAWGKDAENAATYLTTGQTVNIVGSIRKKEPDTWLDKNSGLPRAKWTFTADRIEYGPKSSRHSVAVEGETEIGDSDIENGFWTD